MKFLIVFDRYEREILLNVAHIVRIDKQVDGQPTIILSNDDIIGTRHTFSEIWNAIAFPDDYSRPGANVIEPACKALLKTDSMED